MKRLISRFDVDGDGRIDYIEFLDMCDVVAVEGAVVAVIVAGMAHDLDRDMIRMTMIVAHDSAVEREMAAAGVAQSLMISLRSSKGFSTMP